MLLAVECSRKARSTGLPPTLCGRWARRSSQEMSSGTLVSHKTRTELIRCTAIDTLLSDTPPFLTDHHLRRWHLPLRQGWRACAPDDYQQAADQGPDQRAALNRGLPRGEGISRNVKEDDGEEKQS